MNGRSALITGAGGGIGRCVVKRLMAAGFSVMATDVAAPDTPASWGRALDVTCPDAWRSAIDGIVGRWGRLDVLMNIAGVARAGQFVDIDRGEIDRHFAVNVSGPMHGVHIALPHMLASRSGHIVNVGSLAAVAPVPGIALYSSTKFALRGFTLALATELRGSGVAVTAVHPDLVDTPMIADQIDQPEAAYSFSGPRVLSADEVAAVLTTDVLDRRPLELFLPPSRGLMCRTVGAFPSITTALEPILRRRGLAAQAEARARRAETFGNR